MLRPPCLDGSALRGVAGQQLITTLEVEPMAIKVVETIKEGKTIYTRP